MGINQVETIGNLLLLLLFSGLSLCITQQAHKLYLYPEERRAGHCFVLTQDSASAGEVGVTEVFAEPVQPDATTAAARAPIPLLSGRRRGGGGGGTARACCFALTSGSTRTMLGLALERTDGSMPASMELEVLLLPFFFFPIAGSFPRMEVNDLSFFFSMAPWAIWTSGVCVIGDRRNCDGGGRRRLANLALGGKRMSAARGEVER